MPFSVALNQPKFAPGDMGGLGEWSDILSSIVDITKSAAQVGTAYLISKPTTSPTAQAQIAALQQQAGLPVPYSYPPGYTAPSQSITASPMFWPLVGGLGLLLVAVVAKGRR